MNCGFDEEHIMLYKYQWTEDGEIEYGSIEKQVATSDLECYHCGGCIKKNEVITLFKRDDTYTICQKCSDKLFKSPIESI